MFIVQRRVDLIVGGLAGTVRPEDGRYCLDFGPHFFITQKPEMPPPITTMSRSLMHNSGIRGLRCECTPSWRYRSGSQQTTQQLQCVSHALFQVSARHKPERAQLAVIHGK